MISKGGDVGTRAASEETPASEGASEFIEVSSSLLTVPASMATGALAGARSGVGGGLRCFTGSSPCFSSALLTGDFEQALEAKVRMKGSTNEVRFVIGLAMLS